MQDEIEKNFTTKLAHIWRKVLLYTIYWYLQKFLHQSWRPRNFKFYKKSNFLKIIFECKRIWLRCVEQLTIKKLWWWYFMFSKCFQLFIKNEIFGNFTIPNTSTKHSKFKSSNYKSLLSDHLLFYEYNVFTKNLWFRKRQFCTFLKYIMYVLKYCER